jgi:hypothetical protein
MNLHLPGAFGSVGTLSGVFTSFLHAVCALGACCKSAGGLWQQGGVNSIGSGVLGWVGGCSMQPGVLLCPGPKVRIAQVLSY